MQIEKGDAENLYRGASRRYTRYTRYFCYFATSRQQAARARGNKSCRPDDGANLYHIEFSDQYAHVCAREAIHHSGQNRPFRHVYPPSDKTDVTDKTTQIEGKAPSFGVSGAVRARGNLPLFVRGFLMGILCSKKSFATNTRARARELGIFSHCQIVAPVRIYNPA